MRKRTTQEEIVFSERAARIMEMRKDRIRWNDIGKELKLSVDVCSRIYKEALARYPSAMTEEYREEELNLADDAVHDLLSIARGDVVVRTRRNKNGEEYEVESWPSFKDRIEAWTAISRWSEHKMKITGGFAPTQIQFTTDSIQAEIDRLTLQMSTEEGPAIEA